MQKESLFKYLLIINIWMEIFHGQIKNVEV